MGLHEDFLRALEEAVQVNGGVAALAARIGVSPSTVSRWRNRQRCPTFHEGEKLCETLRLHLVSEDVLHDLSQHEDFVSVPVVDPYQELHPGFIPESQITGWCRVDRSYESVRGRGDLCVVRVMDDASKTIKDGSLVLVDREDREIVNHRLYLIRQYGVMGVRRLYVANGGTSIIWKDLLHGETLVHTLEDARDAVVGKAVWIRGSIEDGRQLILDGRV